MKFPTVAAQESSTSVETEEEKLLVELDENLVESTLAELEFDRAVTSSECRGLIEQVLEKVIVDQEFIKQVTQKLWTETDR